MHNQCDGTTLMLPSTGYDTSNSFVDMSSHDSSPNTNLCTNQCMSQDTNQFSPKTISMNHQKEVIEMTPEPAQVMRLFLNKFLLLCFSVVFIL